MVIIKAKKSVIPSLDMDDLSFMRRIVKETCKISKVSSYKIGFELVINFGMKKVVSEIRKLTKKPIIYDHQKAATDIPDTAEKFAKSVHGVNAVILFPQSGPLVEKTWIKAMQKYNLGVIVGGEMTHDCYLESDDGFILQSAPKRIYGIAASLGVLDFVVPGNKPNKILEYREFLMSKGIDPIFYSPGLITQGGKISESAIAAGDNWHAIIGRGIYEAKDIKKATLSYVRLLK